MVSGEPKGMPFGITSGAGFFAGPVTHLTVGWQNAAQNERQKTRHGAGHKAAKPARVPNKRRNRVGWLLTVSQKAFRGLKAVTHEYSPL